ncbi:MAG: aldehyde ferredoxin oxidoreductase family protein [Deltaproteobacteria bacterium]|nr:aldehyde ferredoxin oxidoreductase family protein [Deltaproteobacteria bacterium]
MHGYHGRFLEVNLNDHTTQDLPISQADAKKYIGGATLGAALVYDRLTEKIDGLSPENPLVFSTGPLTGTRAPMVSRYAVCGISPLTGFWGEATSGGSFPFRLKGAGYDGILITGKSKNPVYLSINKGEAEIRDASHLWGKDSYETQALIKNDLPEDNISVACIGSGGENQIRYACIMNDKGRAAGRCGMGAVMGSKNLKAVAVSGNLKPTLSDSEKLNATAKQLTKEIMTSLNALALREYGTLMYMDMGMVLGDTVAKYFTQNTFPAERVSGQEFRQKYLIKNYACLGCPIGCGRDLKNFRPGLDVDGPEYETAAAFGPLCMNTDKDSIVEANHLCNVHGIDTISAGVSIAYAFYLFDLGVLTKEKAGMELKWGDGKAIVKLVNMIINGEGIGKILSRGTLAMAREFDRDEGEAAQIKGLEMPMHDGRAFHGEAISYATGPRGACHLKGDYYVIELGGMVPEYEIYPGDRLSSVGKAVQAAKFQSLKDLFDALTMCKFAPVTPSHICELLNAITGWDYDPAALLAAGDRSMAIKRAISNLQGVNRTHDALPAICAEPLKDGFTAGIKPDMDLMLKEYYAHRGWDEETGKPTKETLAALDLKHVADKMYA